MINLKIVCDDDKYMPTYANDTDACMDIKIRIRGLSTSSLLLPNNTKVFGTGIKVAIPEDYVMLIYPRSSTGIKLQCRLANSTAVIDSGYRDEIKLAITNFGHDIIKIDDGQRLAQFMIIPRPQINLISCVDNEEFRKGDRGGGVGSTGV